MALDYAKTADERAAVALLAGPGARLTGRFGARGQVVGAGRTNANHAGLDVAGEIVGAQVPLFSPVAFDGVWYSSRDAYGALDLFLGDKYDGLRLVHNSRNIVTKGRVAAGTHVATMGRTGKVNGVHVHAERYENGRVVDPLPWLISLLRGTTSKSTAPATDTTTSTRRVVRIGDMKMATPTRFGGPGGVYVMWPKTGGGLARILINGPEDVALRKIEATEAGSTVTLNADDMAAIDGLTHRANQAR